MKNLCAFFHDGTLEESFWGHIYSIGGVAPKGNERDNSITKYYGTYTSVPNDLDEDLLDVTLAAPTRIIVAYDGQYYLDSDKLENYLHLRHDSM